MRILIIWGESLAKPGGGAAHCIGLAGGLEACGHRVTIITPRYGRQRLNTGDLDVRPIPLPPRGMFSFLCFQLITVLYLPYWLFRHRPQVLYVRTCFLQGIMDLISRLAGAPLVGEIDSLVDTECLMRGQPAWQAALMMALDRLNNRLSSGLVCVSRGLREETIRRGGRAITTITAHNGAQTDIMRPSSQSEARNEFGLPEDTVIVGFAGTLAPWQGLDFLVEAAELLKERKDLNIRIALLGSGQAEAQLRRWIRQRELEPMFILLPPAPFERVAKFLNACDAAVIPIHDKRKIGYCSPLKFWDAISVGIPVLVPEGSELEDVLDDLGLPGVFNPSDPQTLGASLVSLTENVQEYRHRKEEVHRLVTQRYSWRNVAEKVASLMERLN